jgi:hypothetical protein
MERLVAVLEGLVLVVVVVLPGLACLARLAWFPPLSLIALARGGLRRVGRGVRLGLLALLGALVAGRPAIMAAHSACRVLSVCLGTPEPRWAVAYRAASVTCERRPEADRLTIRQVP